MRAMLIRAIRVAVLIVLGSAALAQEQQDASVFNDWQVLCAAEQCRLSQTLISPEDGLQILRVRVFAGDVPTVVMTTPLGVFLKPGLIVKVDDGRARAYAYEICDTEGCHVGVTLDRDLFRAFRRGVTASISFFDGAQNPVEVPVSLIGFTAGFEALSQ